MSMKKKQILNSEQKNGTERESNKLKRRTDLSTNIYYSVYNYNFSKYKRNNGNKFSAKL